MKVKLIKLEGGTAAPRGREKLESLGLEQAPPARFCLFPLWSGFASPALICDQRAPRVGNAAVWCEKIEGLRRV